MTTYQEPIRKLDLLKRRGRAGGVTPATLRRGEAGQLIRAYITLDGEPFALSGYTARFCAVNALGLSVIQPATVVNASKGEVSYAVTSDLTASAGTAYLAYFELVKSGEVATSDTIPLVILENTDISDAKAAEYQSLVDKLVAELESIRDRTVLTANDIDGLLSGNPPRNTKLLDGEGLSHLWSMLGTVTVRQFIGG